MIVGVIGLVGNSFSVLSFARQRIQRVFHRLLLALATFDSVNYYNILLIKIQGKILIQPNSGDK